MEHMNTRNFPASVLLLAVGAGAVLLIGAFARFDPASSPNPAAPSPSPPPLTQDDPPAEAADGPTLPVDLSPGLSEIIKLAQAHVDESVILAYIKNSGQVFSPTADEILYLSDLGLSQDVIGTVVKTAPLASAPLASAPQTDQDTAAAPGPAPAAEGAPAAASQPQPDPSAGVFYNDLASYGTWTQQPDYGVCWQPTVETIDTDWRPYVDAGQWLSSDSGWYWQSDYTWGWAAFHYGRWAKVPRLGWVWVPGKIWAPAWVAWRSTPSYIGWAPLPPGVSLNVLAQLTYLGKPAGSHSTFGLSSSAYTFVNTGDLTSRHLPRRVLPANQVNSLVQITVVIDNYAIVNHRIFNGGASREAVAAAAHKAVPEVTLRAVSSPEAAGLGMDRKTLAVYRPAVSGASPAGPRVINNSRVQAAAERLPSQKPIVLAENDPADAAVMPVAPDGGELSVQLPPLRYAAPAGPPVVGRHHRDSMVASAPNPATAGHNGPRGFGTTAVEHPSTPAPAPRFNGFNPPGRQIEPPRVAMENRPVRIENRPVQVESRPAPVQPARAAPAPAAPAAAASPSKSGK
jgi:hypothetical protein